MGYIGTDKLSILLQHHKHMQALVVALKIQINQIINEKEDDAIYDLATKRNIDGLPGSGKIQDRTANIALGGKMSNETMEAVRELINELNLVTVITEKIDISLRILKPIERQLIQAKYFNQATWREIIKQTGLSQHTAREKLKETMNKLANICNIKIDEYRKLIILIERMV